MPRTDELESLEELPEAFRWSEAALTGNVISALDHLSGVGDHAVRCRATEILHDHHETRAFRNPRPAEGLKRDFQNTQIRVFGTDFASAYTEVTWPLGLARSRGGWKLVAAQVFWMDN